MDPWGGAKDRPRPRVASVGAADQSSGRQTSAGIRGFVLRVAMLLHVELLLRRTFVHLVYFAPESLLPRSVAKSRSYDRKTIDIARRVLRDDSTWIDAGANLGVISTKLQRAAPKGHGYAIEPIDFLAADLRSRLPGVSIWQVALGTDRSTVELRVNRDNPAVSSVKVRPSIEAGHAVEVMTVEMMPLDDIVDPSHVVDFIKIDVENFELEVIRGSRRILSTNRPVVVFESTRALLPPIIEVFRSCGLVVMTVDAALAGITAQDEELLEGDNGTGDYYFVALDPECQQIQQAK